MAGSGGGAGPGAGPGSQAAAGSTTGSFLNDPQSLMLMGNFLTGFGGSAGRAGANSSGTFTGLSQGFAGGAESLNEGLLRQSFLTGRGQEQEEAQRKADQRRKLEDFVKQATSGLGAQAGVTPGISGATTPAAQAPAGGPGNLSLSLAQQAGAAGLPNVALGQLAQVQAARGEERRFQRGVTVTKEAEKRALASAKDLVQFKSDLPGKSNLSEFTKLQGQQAALERAREIAVANDKPTETLDRQIKRTSGRIDKLSTTVGRTEQDVAEKTSQREGAKIAAERRDEFERQSTDVVNLFRRGNEVVNTLEQGGGSSIIGFAGAFNRLGNSINEQSKALASQFGLSREVKKYDFQTFPKEAQNSAIIKGAMLDLAILKAGATGAGTGRALSDKDVQFQLNSLGQGAGSAETFAGTLTETLRQVGLDVQTRRRTLIPGDENFDIFGFAKESGVDATRFGTGRFQGKQDLEFDPLTQSFR